MSGKTKDHNNTLQRKTIHVPPEEGINIIKSGAIGKIQISGVLGCRQYGAYLRGNVALFNMGTIQGPMHQSTEEKGGAVVPLLGGIFCIPLLSPGRS